MIDSIELTNFKKHKSVKFNFANGFQVLQGQNAAGKSTVLKAINYLLAGSSAAGTKEHLRTWGADSPMVVKGKIQVPGYGLVDVVRGERTASVSQGDKILASGNTAVNSFFETAFGMPYSSLRMILYSAQGDTQALLSLGATELQRRMEVLSKLSVIDDVMGLLGTDLMKAEVEQEVLDREAPENVGDLEALRKELHSQEQVSQSLKQDEKNLTEKMEKLASEIKRLQAIEIKRQKAQASLEAGKEWLENRGEAEVEKARQDVLEIEKKSVGGMSGLEREANEAGKKYQELCEKSNAKAELIKQLEKAQRAEQSAAEVVAANEKWLREYTEHKKLMGPLAEKLAEKEAEAANLALKKEGICPKCKRPLEGHEEVDYALLERQTKQALLELDSLRSQMEALGKKEQKARAMLDYQAGNRLELAKKERESLEQRIPEFKEDFEQMAKKQNEKYTELLGQLKAQKHIQESLEKAKGRLEGAEQRLREGALKIAALEKELDAIAPVDFGEKLKEKDDISEELEAVRKKNANITAELKQMLRTVEDTEKAVEKAKQARERLESLNKKIVNLRTLQKFLKTGRSAFSSEIWEGLLNYASSLIGLATQGVLTGLSRSEKGQFWILENGRAIPVAECSGAQASVVGLGIRIAMSKVFYGNGLCLLLDEVTSDCTEETAAAVAGMLQSTKMQIISVSHRAGDAINSAEIIEIE
jgi:DNA repair exonuclease SbcCD ATPase subunit